MAVNVLRTIYLENQVHSWLCLCIYWRDIPQTSHITLSNYVLKRCKFGWARSVIIGTSHGNCNAFHSVSPLTMNFVCCNFYPCDHVTTFDCPKPIHILIDEFFHWESGKISD